MDTIDMILTGHRNVGDIENREPIMIHPDVRQRLHALLFEPEFRAVGYSAFIERACDVAETAIAQSRTGTRTGRMSCAQPNLSSVPSGPDSPEANIAAGETGMVPHGCWVGEGR